MNKSKKIVCLLSKWKSIKNNGHDRRKRKVLIQNILNPSLKKNQYKQNKEIQATSASAERSNSVDCIKSVEFFDSNNIQINLECEHQEAYLESEHQEAIVESEHQGAIEVSDCYEDSWDIELDEINCPEVESICRRSSLISDLNTWSSKHNIRHTALNNLIKLLNLNVCDLNLPKDARTIMATPTKRFDITSDGNGGLYWHYGAKKALLNCLATIDIQNNMEIPININVDGLPLYRSSRKEFWPILLNIHKKPEIPPMVIGIYCGNGNS